MFFCRASSLFTWALFRSSVLDFANHERFDAGFVSALGDGISFRGDAELTALIIKVLHEQEDVLIERLLLLPQFAFRHLAVVSATRTSPRDVCPSPG